MINTFKTAKIGFKTIAVIVSISVFSSAIYYYDGQRKASAYANIANLPLIPAPGTLVTSSVKFSLPNIKGLKIYPDKPFKFDFIVDTGDKRIGKKRLKQESEKIIKYFLAALTVSEDKLWVNLSPYEKDRIISKELQQTIMGRDLLAQDYILKQLTASLTYPKSKTGKRFWKRVYRKARKQLGTAKIPVNTYNKIWIVPETAVVYEYTTAVSKIPPFFALQKMARSRHFAKQNDGQKYKKKHKNVGANGRSPVIRGQTISVFIKEAKLKVMLEEDYYAQAQIPLREYSGQAGQANFKTQKNKSEYKQIFKRILLPIIEEEINNGRNFAKLRQIYHSMILALWYKENLKQTLIGKSYVNQNKTKGIESGDKKIKEKIYNQYIEAYKKGVYNYIKKEYDPAKKKKIRRKYFSGGFEIPNKFTIEKEDKLTASDLNPKGEYKQIGTELTRLEKVAEEVHSPQSIVDRQEEVDPVGAAGWPPVKKEERIEDIEARPNLSGISITVLRDTSIISRVINLYFKKFNRGDLADRLSAIKFFNEMIKDRLFKEDESLSKRTIKAIEGVLRDKCEDSNARRSCAAVLVKAAEQGGEIRAKALAGLTAGSKDEDRNVRWGCEAALVKAAKQEEEVGKQALVKAAEQEGDIGKQTLEGLVTGLRYGDSESALALVKAAEQGGEIRKQALAALPIGLEDETIDVRWICAAALVKAEEQGGEIRDQALEILIVGLEDEDIDARWGCALGLVKAAEQGGEIRKQALEALAAGSENENINVRWICAAALVKAAEQGAIAIISFLENNHFYQSIKANKFIPAEDELKAKHAFIIKTHFYLTGKVPSEDIKYLGELINKAKEDEYIKMMIETMAEFSRQGSAEAQAWLEGPVGAAGWPPGPVGAAGWPPVILSQKEEMLIEGVMKSARQTSLIPIFLEQKYPLKIRTKVTRSLAEAGYIDSRYSNIEESEIEKYLGIVKDIYEQVGFVVPREIVERVIKGELKAEEIKGKMPLILVEEPLKKYRGGEKKLILKKVWIGDGGIAETNYPEFTRDILGEFPGRVFPRPRDLPVRAARINREEIPIYNIKAEEKGLIIDGKNLHFRVSEEGYGRTLEYREGKKAIHFKF